IDTTWTDERDGQVGRVGYEISFTRYFYKYQPPRPLEEIEADIRLLEQDILGLLSDLIVDSDLQEGEGNNGS
ncbi:MAG: hypothetical protein KC418_18150, partial [Anaerolineales bacterium]|nr:hypothetical protein [Anaerolineales bacterium]